MMIKGLSESASAVLPQVSRFIKACDALVSYDKTLSQASALLHEAHIALSEALHTLQSYSQNIDSDPNAFQHLAGKHQPPTLAMPGNCRLTPANTLRDSNSL